MVKKGANKKRIVKAISKIKSSKKSHPKKRSPSRSKKTRDTERILVENFVSLQKVMVNLSVKFENLTQQISKLLDLFEISAKALAEKDFEVEKNNKENIEMLGKMDNVLDQNKTIAKGLSLMHERIDEPQNYPPRGPPLRSPPLQRMPIKHTPRILPPRRTLDKYPKLTSPTEE